MRAVLLGILQLDLANDAATSWLACLRHLELPGVENLSAPSKLSSSLFDRVVEIVPRVLTA